MSTELLKLIEFFREEDYAIPCHEQDLVSFYDEAIVEQLFFALWMPN